MSHLTGFFIIVLEAGGQGSSNFFFISYNNGGFFDYIHSQGLGGRKGGRAGIRYGHQKLKSSSFCSVVEKT